MANTLYLSYLVPSSIGGGIIPLNGGADGNAATYQALVGASNLLAPPYVSVETTSPLLGGGFFSFVNVGVRVITLPILVRGTSFSDLWTKARALVTAFDPTVLRGSPTYIGANPSGVGILHCTAPDGAVRELNGNFVAGLDGVLDDQNYGAGFLVVPAEFHAVDPFWYDTSSQTDTRTNISNNTNDTHTITNIGDAETSNMTWAINFTVPASTGAQTLAITLTNNTSGYVLSITGVPVGATGGSPVNHSVNISYSRSARIFQLDATDITQYVSMTAALWPLCPGANSVTYKVAGSVAVNNTISVQAQYLNRWNTL